MKVYLITYTSGKMQALQAYTMSEAISKARRGIAKVDLITK